MKPERKTQLQKLLSDKVKLREQKRKNLDKPKK